MSPQISSAIAIRLVLFGLMAPIAAALIESYGVRRDRDRRDLLHRVRGCCWH